MLNRLELLVLVCLFCSSSSWAEDWTRFRGKNGQGVSDAQKIPSQWSDADLHWKTKLPGMGHSSPVQLGKTIFVQSADPESATRYVIAIDSDTGKIKWEKKFASTTHRFHRLNSYNSSTPAVDSKRVYVTWSNKAQITLKAFHHDGQEIWSKDLGSWVGQHGYAASPIVYRDKVILVNSQQKNQLNPGEKPGQSRVMAFDGKTGQTVWTSDRVTTRVSYSVPCIYQNEKGDDELVCCNTAEGVYSLNPQNGKRNWYYQGAFDKRTVSSPVFAGGLILGSCGSGGGGNFVVAIRPGSQPSMQYKVDRNANYVPTPVAYQNRLYLVSDKGIASCVDSGNGKVLWQERLSGEYWASPIRIQKRIYVINAKGVVTVFAAADKFQLLGKSELGEKCHSTPAVADGKLVLRTVSHLMSVGGER
jgi:outer membrane protein assembly factor BamB